MKIILKKTYQDLGNRGDIKEVKPGFARNFLIPQDIVLPATDSNVVQIQKLLTEEKKAEKETIKKLESLKDKLEGLKLEIKAKADSRGKLFGSVGKKEIQKNLKAKIGVAVPIKKIDLSKSIKKVGDYEVILNISAQLKPKVKVKVVKF